MTIIKLDIPDRLAEKLAPYQDQLTELLEIGLQKWQEQEQQNLDTSPEKLFQILATSDMVSLPKPYVDKQPYVDRTPVSTTGMPASEIIIEQRGSL